jgi:hypothetical protein
MASPESTNRTAVRTRIAFGILLLSAAVLWSLDGLGKRRRHFASGHDVLALESPAQALDAWRERGVAGRTLVLFGPFPHLWRSSYVEGVQQVTEQSFVERAALENRVRRVYFLVPDESWDAMFGVELPGFYRKVPGLDRGLYMHYALGLPVIATTPGSLPAMDEPVLAYVDRGRFDVAFAQELLAKKGITFDLLVASTGM